MITDSTSKTLKPSWIKLLYGSMQIALIGIIIGVVCIVLKLFNILESLVLFVTIFGTLGIFIAFIESRNRISIDDGYLITIKNSKALFDPNNDDKIKIDSITDIKLGSKYQPLANSYNGSSLGFVYNVWKRKGILIQSSNKSFIIEVNLYDKKKISDFINLLIHMNSKIKIDENL